LIDSIDFPALLRNAQAAFIRLSATRSSAEVRFGKVRSSPAAETIGEGGR
jgi:hypothetical protein